MRPTPRSTEMRLSSLVTSRSLRTSQETGRCITDIGRLSSILPGAGERTARRRSHLARPHAIRQRLSQAYSGVPPTPHLLFQRNLHGSTQESLRSREASERAEPAIGREVDF